MEKTEQQTSRDTFRAKKEADRIFSEKQQLKAQKIRDEERRLQDFNVTLMVKYRTHTHTTSLQKQPIVLQEKLWLLYIHVQAAKIGKTQQQRREEQELEAKNAEVLAEEENHFQHYAQRVISAAAAAERNVHPLQKAAREGIGGGLGPVFSGVRPSYLVQDASGAQMPKYVCDATRNTKNLNEAADIQEAKRRLGFTW